ncbi:MAG: flagellar export protein FliJ [Pseudomonadales bacterium]|nr:flagellar FliJ family protein [Pseudomonadales bacterium]
MAHDKLLAVKKVYSARERRLAAALAAARAARDRQVAQAEALEGMLVQYRNDQPDSGEVNPRRLAMLHRFYQQVSETLVLHSRQVNKLDEREARARARWHDARVDERAIDRLLEKRAQELKVLARRKGRRPGAGKPRDWTMLNLSNDNEGS